VNTLRTSRTARAIAALAAISVLAGAAGAPMQAAQQRPDDAPSSKDEQTAAHGPGALLHILQLAAAPGSTQVTFAQSTTPGSVSLGAGVLAERLDRAKLFTSRSQARASIAFRPATSLLRGIVWPMGP
jgi:hypothetical protein